MINLMSPSVNLMSLSVKKKRMYSSKSVRVSQTLQAGYKDKGNTLQNGAHIFKWVPRND